MTSNRANRFKRRQQKRLAEKAIGGKLTSHSAIDLSPGVRIPVKVRTPHTDASGCVRIVGLFALLVVEDDGRTHLEALPGYEFNRPGEPQYCATIDIEGYADWRMISNIPVEISRHTGRHTYTKLVIQRLARFDPESRL